MEVLSLHKSRTGQICSLDVILGGFVFLLVISAFIWCWSEVQHDIWIYEHTENMKNRAVEMTDMLLKTSSPEGPRESEGEIAYSMNVLDRTALEEFYHTPYESLRSTLGLSSEDYYIEIRDLDGEILYSLGKRGKCESVVERFALLSNRVVKFVLCLYKRAA